MGTSGSLEEDFQSRSALVGIGQGFAQGVAGQQAGIGGGIRHPGEEGFDQRLRFRQPERVLLCAFQSLLPNFGFHRIDLANQVQGDGGPLRIGILALVEFPAGMRPALGMGESFRFLGVTAVGRITIRQQDGK
jgi:hypothetical protein